MLLVQGKARRALGLYLDAGQAYSWDTDLMIRFGPQETGQSGGQQLYGSGCCQPLQPHRLLSWLIRVLNKKRTEHPAKTSFSTNPDHLFLVSVELR